MSIFPKKNSIYQRILDAAYVWRQEIKQVIHDEGVLLFCIVVPLVYPLLSLLYIHE